MQETIMELLDKTVPALDPSVRNRVLLGESLIANGVLDSLSLISFVSEIEREFGFEFGPADMDLQHFESLEKIVALVESKRRAE